MPYEDKELPDGKVLTAADQAMFREVSSMLHVAGCSSVHDEPMDYDPNTAANELSMLVAMTYGVEASDRVDRAFVLYQEIAHTPHDRNWPLCRHSSAPAQLEPLFERSGLNADLYKLLL